MVKRAKDEVQKPNIWELPGGRLSPGEDPFIGLIREIREETGLYIKPLLPMRVAHFQRDDKQTITLMIFLCKPLHNNIKLSEEHTDFDWIKVDDNKLDDFYKKEVEMFKKFELNKYL